MMRIPTEWLREYVDTDLSPEALAELLTGLGIEIEEIHDAPEGLGGKVLVAEVTPNRGDCLSVLGIAYEVAAATGAVLKPPSLDLVESSDRSAGDAIAVSIDAPDLCPRYAARLVSGVGNKPSPTWMQLRLLACGQKPRNLLVDVTNYVMFELGQPLHAFDAELLGGRIGVRRAHEGETFVTLDNVKRTLGPEHLLITNGDEPVALAGVMGGANTAVSEQSHDVVLEAAHFDPANVRRTARTLGIETESSYRFARTVDPGLPIDALARAAQLLADLGGGEVARGVVDVTKQPIEPARITLRRQRCNGILGAELALEQMQGYLQALGLEAEPDGENLQVIVPTRRQDLEREIDLIEEIARLHGFDQLPTTVYPSRQVGRLTERQSLERRVRELLLAAGLNETVTYSLTSAEAAARAALGQTPDDVGAVALQNPLSSDYSLLRWSMLPSVLEVAGRNASLHDEPVRIFELGRTYRNLNRELTDEQAEAAGRVASGATATELPVPCDERLTLGIAVTGQSLSSGWNVPEEQVAADFFHVKGILELILAELQVGTPCAEPLSLPLFEEGQAARIAVDGQPVATLGVVHPDVADGYEIRGTAVVAEMDLGWLLEQAQTRRVFRALPRQPAALRDIALVVPDSTPQAAIEHEIRGAAMNDDGTSWLEQVALFDVYRGKGVDAGHRSLAYNLMFRHPSRTLNDAEVDAVMDRIIARVGTELGAKLRE